tara:strand:- start:232 stop:399 length:168 start_codon:yes stop_codon:yes gene_type:complete
MEETMRSKYVEELIALDKRNQKIVKLREGGMPFQKIADEVGISRQRVEQIYHRDK